MKKLPVLVTAGILSAIIAGASFAGQGKGGYDRDGHRGHKDRALEQLNLSDEQKTSIAELKATQREAYKAQRQTDQTQEGVSATPDQADYEEQVQAYAQKKAAAMEARIIQKFKMKAEIYALLTPEQQSQLVEIRQEMKEKRALRKERRKQKQQEQPLSN